MRGRWSRSLRHLAVLAGMAVVGTALAVFVLMQQRFSDPTADTYEVKVELREAHGVVSGFGQPVTVAGVEIGSIKSAQLADGKALVTLVIEREELPRIYRNASVTLRPATPLGDPELQLDPGRASAGALPEGGTLPSRQTNAPVRFEELLSALDTDTREFLTVLIGSLDVGTRRQALNLRGFFRALGPTTAQVGELSEALATRRRELARLVHNLASVTRAATQDEELASVVQSGNATLQAIAENEAPLRSSIAQLPRTLRATREMLVDLTQFAEVSGPALEALTPAVRRMPRMLSALRPFATEATPILRRQLRPFTREAQPALRDMAPALVDLDDMTPHLERSFRVLQYWVNETAYNPPGDDEGGLFWYSWAAHNLASWFASGQDANGGLGRGTVVASCSEATAAGAGFNLALGEILNITEACNDVVRR